MAVLPFVQIPRIHWAWTREHVNVQDYVDGIAGHDLGQLDAAGLDRRLLDWTRDGHTVPVEQLESDIEAFIDQYHGTPLAELSLGRTLDPDFNMTGEALLLPRQDLSRLMRGARHGHLGLDIESRS